MPFVAPPPGPPPFVPNSRAPPGPPPLVQTSKAPPLPQVAVPKQTKLFSPTETELTRFKRKAKEEGRKYLCYVCYVGFYCRGNYNAHVKGQKHILKVSRDRRKINDKMYKNDPKRRNVDRRNFVAKAEAKQKRLGTDFLWCTLCNANFPNAEQLEGHFNSNKHQKKLALKKHAKETKLRFFCNICVVECNTQDVLNKHMQGKPHQQTVQKRQQRKAAQQEYLMKNSSRRKPQPPKVKSKQQKVKKEKTFRCKICNMEIKGRERMMEHVKSKMHLKNMKSLKCELCDIQLKSKKDYQKHLKSTMHILVAKKRKRENDDEAPRKKPRKNLSSLEYCPICGSVDHKYETCSVAKTNNWEMFAEAPYKWSDTNFSASLTTSALECVFLFADDSKRDLYGHPITLADEVFEKMMKEVISVVNKIVKRFVPSLNAYELRFYFGDWLKNPHHCAPTLYIILEQDTFFKLMQSQDEESFLWPEDINNFSAFSTMRDGITPPIGFAKMNFSSNGTEIFQPGKTFLSQARPVLKSIMPFISSGCAGIRFKGKKMVSFVRVKTSDFDSLESGQQKELLETVTSLGWCQTHFKNQLLST